MHKIIVVPANKPVFMVTTSGEEIQAFRPTVVAPSGFISQAITQNKLRLATDVKLLVEATDSEFQKLYFSDTIVKTAKGNDQRRAQLAIEAFVDKYSATKQDDAKIALEEEQRLRDEEAAKEKALEERRELKEVLRKEIEAENKKTTKPDDKSKDSDKVASDKK